MDLPKKITQVLRSFEEVFGKRVWEWAKVLLIGAILAPGERTVTAILRVRVASSKICLCSFNRHNFSYFKRERKGRPGRARGGHHVLLQGEFVLIAEAEVR